MPALATLDPTGAHNFMKAEIISIGTELTTGRNLDTNSQWLSLELARMGVPVQFHSTVADDLADNVAVIRTAVERADLVVVTGGLGPTQDDLTREALAAVAGVDLVLDEPSLHAIQERFAQRKRVMAERNRVQALFPRGAEPIENPHGTAPGIWMAVPKKRAAASSAACATEHSIVIAMPGVPDEMYRMFEERVRPRLAAQFGGSGVIVQRKINAFGAGESDIESRLLDLTQRGRVPEVGITVHDGVISLRIITTAASESEARTAADPTAHLIYERLGNLVFGEGDETLAGVVASMLASSGVTLSLAEGCTGGLIAARLTQFAGATQWFRGGIVAYDDVAKSNLLGVTPEQIAEHGALSAVVVETMASACRRRLGSDIAMAVSGISGPAGATAEQPVGLTWLALASPAGVTSRRVQVIGENRMAIQSRAAHHAINLVRQHLLQRTSQNPDHTGSSRAATTHAHD